MVCNDYLKRGRALSIVIGGLLIFLVFMGSAGALSDAVSDNVWDNNFNITSSNGNGRPLDTLHPQSAKQFSSPVGAANMSVQTAAQGDVNITKIGHLGGPTYAIEVLGNYAYTSQGSDFVVLNISNKMAPVEAGRAETSDIIEDIALAGNYAYVAEWENDILKIDVDL